jgi:hypothetical protein
MVTLGIAATFHQVVMTLFATIQKSLTMKMYPKLSKVTAVSKATFPGVKVTYCTKKIPPSRLQSCQAGKTYGTKTPNDAIAESQ